MNYNASFAISAAGMDIERMRVEMAAQNLANANTVAGHGDPTYRPMHVVARSAGTAVPAFGRIVSNGMELAPTATIEPGATTPRMVYEPGHPMADERGFVTYPGVDNLTEMLTMMSATRSYEANVAAMNTARTLAMKALDIGGAT